MTSGVYCPKCKAKRSCVLDTADTESRIRRRRRCLECRFRWSTTEVNEDEAWEPYDLIARIRERCHKDNTTNSVSAPK